MADPAIERSLRRAFSHREKARHMERDCARAFDAGDIESARYASLREFYANHIRQAEAAIENLREEIRGRRASYLEQFRAVDNAQAELGQQLASGRLKPDEANRKNRKLMESANACRAAMAECDRLLAITSSQEVGGFLDMPLADFSETADGSPERDEQAVDWERVFAYALPFLIAGTVFLPWLTLEGTSKSLPSLEDFGRVLGLPGMLGPVRSNVLWIGFMLLPLGALPVAAMSRNRPSGIALIVAGFLLIWAMLTGILGLPSVSTAPDITLTTVIRALHIGPFLYFGGAIGLIILGQRRLQMRESTSSESSGSAILIMSACMIFLMVIAASSVWVQVQEGFVAYDARVVDERTGAINILLTNEGRVPASIFAPWPGGVVGREPVRATGDVYGLSVQVRERGDTEFRILSESRGAWLSSGLPIHDEAPLLVAPRSRAVLTLAPWYLRAFGVDPEAVRIEFSRRNGELLSRSEHEMPDLRAEPTAPIQVPVPRTLPVPGQPGAPVVEAPEPDPAPEETPPAAQGIGVVFTGLMGDRAVLQVTPPGEAPARVMRGPDEAIGGNWVVLEVSVAPPSVTIFHERSYETIILRMGHSTTLPQ